MPAASYPKEYAAIAANGRRFTYSASNDYEAVMHAAYACKRLGGCDTVTKQVNGNTVIVIVA
jgi:hypothetical protein